MNNSTTAIQSPAHHTKSPELLRLLQEAREYREAEAAKLIRWVPALGEVPPTDVGVASALDARKTAEDAANNIRWAEDSARRRTLKENTQVQIPAALHPSVSREHPSLRYVANPADKLHSRKKLNEIVATVCHVMMLRNRVKLRAEQLMLPTITARTLAANRTVPRLSCLSIPPVVLSDEAGASVEGQQGVVPRDAPQGVISQLRERSSKSVFFDPMDVCVPLEFKLADYPPVNFPEHPFLGSEPAERMSLLPAGDDRCYAHQRTSQQVETSAASNPYSIPNFQQPVIAPDACYPTDDFIQIPATPMPFVPRGYTHPTTPPVGVQAPFHAYDYKDLLPAPTTPRTYAERRNQTKPPLLHRGLEEDRMSDDDDEGTVASLDAIHPTIVRPVDFEGTRVSALPQASYDVLQENPYVSERQDMFVALMNKVLGCVNGATLKQL